MLPDDRVLVGVLNRKRDRTYLLQEQWYRIPQQAMPEGIYTEYLAFFLSGNAAKDYQSSGIYYYAQRHGVELRYRKDLLPHEKSKKALRKAKDTYYKIQFRNIETKSPPITNPTNRKFAFILTTWDRFINAHIIADLYSTNDYFVDRIYHALRDKHIRANRYWDADRKRLGYGASVRIMCESGTLTGYTDQHFNDEHGFFIDPAIETDQLFAQIKARIAQMGGPVTLPLSTSF